MDKRFEETFHKEYMPMANLNMKRWTGSLTIRDMQIKTNTHELYKLKLKGLLRLSLGEDIHRAVGTIMHCWWECQLE